MPNETGRKVDENTITQHFNCFIHFTILFYFTEKKLNEQCSNVMLCVDDAHVRCIGDVCGCNTGYYDNNGPTVGENACRVSY